MTQPAQRPRLVAVEGTVPSREPYPLDMKFERALVTLAGHRPRVYGRIVRLMEAELFNAGEAKTAIGAIHEIARERGTGPDSLLLVIQRLRAKVQAGQMTLEELEQVNEYFDAGMDGGLPSDDTAVQEVVPIIQGRMEHAAIQAALQAKAKKDQPALIKAGQALAAVQAIGKVDTSVGIRVGSASFEQIIALQHMHRLQLGIYDLDEKMNGGPGSGSEVVFVGGPGDGKSMQLSHTCGHNALMGGLWGYATLELPPAIILARLKSFWTGISITDILKGKAEMEEAQRRVKLLEESGRLGAVALQEFTAGAATVDDLSAWVAQVEYEYGMPMRGLFVDYADKLTAPNVTNRNERDEKVYEALRIYAVDKAKISPFWLLTASQAGRKKHQGGAHTDLDDVAGSLDKVRIADLVVTLNGSDEGRMMEWFVAKDRNNASRYKVGPLPSDFAMGRIGPFYDPLDFGPTTADYSQKMAAAGVEQNLKSGSLL